MPRGSDFHIAPYNTAQQFDRFIEKAVTKPASARGTRNDYELLYTRDAHGGSGGSLDFKKRLPSSKTISEWWARRRQRKQTRNEITRLIDESLGKDFAGVRSWGGTKSMGARLVSDLAPQGVFSVTKIDEETLRKIARAVHALRQEISLHKAGAPSQNGVSGTGLLDASINRRQQTTFTLHADKLKTLYSRAAELGPIPEGGRPHDPLPEDDSLLDIKSDDASEEMRTPEMVEQNNSAGPPLIGPDPRNQDMAVIEETENEDWSDSEAEQDVTVTVNREQAISEEAPQADRGAADLALSEAYRRGIDGKDRDRDRAAYHLALAVQKGNAEAAAELQELAENGDRRLQRAVAKVYSEGRDEVDQNTEEAAFWLARSWQGLRAAHAHTDWVAALYGDNKNAAIPPGTMEHALSRLFLAGNDWVDQNTDKAAYFLLLAAQKGDKEANVKVEALAAARSTEGDDLALQLALYRAHRQGGDGVKSDMGQAALWLARAMDWPARQDGGDNAEPRATLSWLEAHIDNPNEDAYMRQLNRGPVLFELSKLYRTGREDIPQDKDKAAYFLALAAEPGVMGAGHQGAIAALKELEGKRQRRWGSEWQVQRTDADSAMQYALHEVYRKGADGVERDLEEAGPWLMRAMREGMEWKVSNLIGRPPYLHFWVSADCQPWEGSPRAIENVACTEYSCARDRSFALFKMYQHGTDGVERDMHAAIYWLIKAKVIVPSDLFNDSKIITTFDALSWQDFKRYADPSFYMDNRDMNYRRDLHHKLHKAVKSAPDPEAFYELAQLYKGGSDRTDTDDNEYAHWLARAAASGHDAARSELQALKINQPNSPDDRRADDAKLQFALGQLYSRGRHELGRCVVEPNLEEAKAYTQLAVENGYGAAADTALEALYAHGLPPRTAPED